jgi:hypothetical protein
MGQWVDVSKRGLTLERCEEQPRGLASRKNNEVVEVVEMGLERSTRIGVGVVDYCRAEVEVVGCFRCLRGVDCTVQSEFVLLCYSVT